MINIPTYVMLKAGLASWSAAEAMTCWGKPAKESASLGWALKDLTIASQPKLSVQLTVSHQRNNSCAGCYTQWSFSQFLECRFLVRLTHADKGALRGGAGRRRLHMQHQQLTEMAFIQDHIVGPCSLWELQAAHVSYLVHRLIVQEMDHVMK